MFPLVRVERLLCRGKVCSCSSSVLCHGAEHGTRVEDIILLAFTLFFVWFRLPPFASEGGLREN